MNQTVTILITLPGQPTPDTDLLVGCLQRYLAPQRPTIHVSSTLMPQSTVVAIVVEKIPFTAVWWLGVWQLIDTTVGPDSILPATMPTTITVRTLHADGRSMDLMIDRRGGFFSMGVEDHSEPFMIGFGPTVEL